MKKNSIIMGSLMLFVFIGMNLSSSPETERIKKCRPVFDKCMDEANKTRNPKYKGMDRDARNAAIKAEREKCKKDYDVCK
ncbi:MAG: hypothetical protein MUD12_16395 [Spirochaetes bacterium]|jgi:hypothetical protein|nr:hypothetical protein [Spirochaetota bacterium]